MLCCAMMCQMCFRDISVFVNLHFSHILMYITYQFSSSLIGLLILMIDNRVMSDQACVQRRSGWVASFYFLFFKHGTFHKLTVHIIGKITKNLNTGLTLPYFPKRNQFILTPQRGPQAD